MKNYILPQSGKFYKANLHCHSTCSDGSKTPEQLKKMYTEKGYSVIAFTDHNKIIDHSDLDDENFLALTSAEYDVNFSETMHHNTPCIHFNLISKEQHFDVTKFEKTEPERYAERKCLGQLYWAIGYGYHGVNAAIAEAAKYGFIATLNHPEWSVLGFEDFKDIEGLFAMEIFNNVSYTQGHFEINDHLYNRMLKSGKRLCAIAADDNHNLEPIVTPISDSFGGFVMIKADELEYGKIFGALRDRNFYASTGPEIFEYYEEDGVLHISTSPAERIAFTTSGRNIKCVYPAEGKESVCEASYKINPDDGFVRVTVYDGSGHYAWTNAYFI